MGMLEKGKMKIASIIFKGLFLISCAFGLSLTVDSAPSFAIFISYYTTQSNILVLVVMSVMFFREFFYQGEKTRFLSVLKSLATVSILVTFLIYHFVLAPNIDPGMTNVSSGLGNIMVHYVTPLWFFIDYLIFDTKGSTRLADPFIYISFLIYYFVFSNLRALNGELYEYGSIVSQFPYPFLDYAVFGIYGVSAAILIISVIVLILGFIFVGLDTVMKKPHARYQTQVYGAISIKPNTDMKFRFFKSKVPKKDTTLSEATEAQTEDPINSIDFLDDDRFE